MSDEPEEPSDESPPNTSPSEERTYGNKRVPFISPDEESGDLEARDAEENRMRAEWADDVRKYIRYTTAFTMLIIASALALDIYLVVTGVESDPSDRLLNTQVILALIAASVAQIGAIAFLIGKSIFK
ncbi:MAG: hypothetical protein AAFU80_06795 [Pseudomonadota bacterium]